MESRRNSPIGDIIKYIVIDSSTCAIVGNDSIAGWSVSPMYQHFSQGDANSIGLIACDALSNS